jgi:hypothetical protein
MQLKANKDLYDLISALAGTSDFTDGEIGQLFALANRRMYEAYNRTSYWARYLVTGEARAITSPATIPFTETDKEPIGEFIRINRSDPFLQNSTVEFDFYVQADGAHILNLSTSESDQAFATYKLRLTQLTGLDASGESSLAEVPQEFFYFMAHATYADFLRLDGQHQKALVEEQVAENYLLEEMENPQQIANNNTVGKRFKTYVSQQSR